MHRPATSLACLIAVLLAVPVQGQGRMWYEAYKRGVAALKAERWSEAIADLSAAVSVEPHCEADKYIGVFRDDYCPQLYLSLAFIGANQFDAAQRALDEAPRAVPLAFVEGFKRARKLLASHHRTTFDIARDQAMASATTKDFRLALAQLDALRRSSPTEFTQQGLHVTRDEVAGKFAAQLTDEGEQLANRSQFSSAAASFGQALEIAPDFDRAMKGLAHIRAKETEYAQLKDAAEESLQKRTFAMAVERLDAARKANPERYKADGLQVQMELAIRGDLHDRAAAGKDAGFLELECDQPCWVRVDDGWTLRSGAGEKRPVAVTTGSHTIVATDTNRLSTWTTTVSVAKDSRTAVEIPISLEMKRRAAMDTQKEKVHAELVATQQKVATMKAERQRLATETQAVIERGHSAEARVRAVIAQIKANESEIERELAQAERDEKDARDADAMARNGALGGNAFGKIVQATGAVTAAAKKISADNHRKRAQQLLVDIDKMTRELYQLTKE